MKCKRIVVPLLILISCATARACTPPYYQTVYFGKREFMDQSLREKIQADIEHNHYSVIEMRIGTWFYPLVSKGNTIYLNGKVIATKDDSFRYFGEGYYRVNRDLFYLGERIGASPRDGSVVVYSINRSSSPPENPPPNFMYCGVSAHADVLETSDGLRSEHLVYDN